MTSEDPHNTRQTLIERVRNQYDEKAWEEFALAYEPYIYAIIRRMGMSPADSKDIHQNVILQIWKKLPEYQKKPGTRFRGWVSTVTANAVRYFMRTKANKSKTIDRFEQEYSTINDNLSDMDKVAEEEWEIFISETAMINVGKTFSGNGVDVFQKTLDGKSVSEIAIELKIEEGSVYQLRARVKKSLIKEIARLRHELD
jgi:RNA polymerase sigma factor (sigma-70 family)